MASSKAGPFSVIMNNVAVTGAITLIQVKAGAASTVEVLKAWVSQGSSTVSTQQRIQINRKSGTATVTSATPAALTGGTTADAVGGTSATGTNASAEGTDSTVLINDVFNILNGWLYVPIPEERITIPPGGFLGLKFPTAPGSSTTYTAGIIFQELG